MNSQSAKRNVPKDRPGFDIGKAEDFIMLKTIEYRADFCVVGGGLAGMCAAIAAARGGAHVVLMQERPVLGGNASSEIRRWVCGAQGKNVRETGI